VLARKRESGTVAPIRHGRSALVRHGRHKRPDLKK
jgi:hypothetical protein